MGVDAGALDREFDIKAPSGLDSSTTIASGVWGSLRMARASELQRFASQQGLGQYIVQLRYRDDLKGDYWLYETETARTFQIEGYGDVDGAQDYLTLFVTERQ